MRSPAPRPCGSCPYRRDTPSGVWTADEYAKLPPFDGETWEQPPSVFLCHQQDGRLCAGWVAVHDMVDSFGLRMAIARGLISDDVAEACFDYTTDVELYASGSEACAAGLRDVERPGAAAVGTIAKLERRQGRTA